MKIRVSLRCIVGVGVLAVSGCGLVLGLDDFEDAAPAGSATSGGATSAGTGGGGTCEPESEVECYSGAPGTEGVGICQAGTQACKQDGSGYEVCSGEVTPAAETCASTEDEDCDGKDCVAWATLIGGAEGEAVNDVAVDAMGNVYVVGTFEGAIPLGEDVLIASGENDAFLVKFSPSGEYLWSRQLGGIYHDTAYAIAVSPEGEAIVAVVEFDTRLDHSEVVLQRYESSGALSWRRALGGSMCGIVPSSVGSMAIVSDGSVVVAGIYCGEIRFDETHAVSNETGLPDAFVAKIRSSDGGIDGREGWVTVFGGDDVQYVADVAVDAADNVVVVGSFWGELRFGDASLQSAGNADAFVAKLTNLGLVSWVRSSGGVHGDRFDSVAVDRFGGPVVVGVFNGTFDLGGGEITVGKVTHVVSRYTTSNIYRWHRTFDMDDVLLGGLSVDARGESLIVGGLIGDVELDGETVHPISADDLLLVKMGERGDLLWARAFGHVGNRGAVALAHSDAHGLFVVGRANGMADFGAGAMVPDGESDGFVAKFVP
ncbi:hypothetical protein WMF31_01425 [Sorangium sp. So ce1036]|uniref:hypothetical protein n=1 Tax=Sorangium sp. So ce1036 TaxID=3133328 RepID=UPI003F0C8603